MRRFLILFAALVLGTVAAPRSADAGGVGFYNGTGLHVGPRLEGEGTGVWLDEGGGLELLLGKDGARLHGRLRFAAVVATGARSRNTRPGAAQPGFELGAGAQHHAYLGLDPGLVLGGADFDNSLHAGDGDGHTTGDDGRRLTGGGLTGGLL